MKFPSKKRSPPRIHLTALIDIVFLLLVFFLLASSFVNQQGTPIVVPEVESEGIELLPEIKVNIDKDALIYFNGVLVNEEILQSLLNKQLKEAPKQTVAIHADRRVQYDRVVQVIDIAKEAGAKEFLLVTQPANKDK